MNARSSDDFDGGHAVVAKMGIRIDGCSMVSSVPTAKTGEHSSDGPGKYGGMMKHYTKNTLECTAWCAKCQKNTQHRVDGGRRGPCLEHDAPKFSKAQEARRRKAADKQGKLF